MHDLPARLVADYLEHAGFVVRYYGANVPTDDLVKLVVIDAPAVLALSVTMSFNVGALREAVARVRGEVSDALPILIGGHAIDWASDLATTLAVETAPASPDELVGVVRRLTRAA